MEGKKRELLRKTLEEQRTVAKRFSIASGKKAICGYYRIESNQVNLLSIAKLFN